MSWEITKTLSPFDYGHNVHDQALNHTLVGSEGAQCVCRHDHGHRGSVAVTLSSPTLANGMVTDFKHLGAANDLLKHYVDHKFLLDIRHPCFHDYIPEYVPASCSHCAHVHGSLFCGNCSTPRSDDRRLILECIGLDGPVCSVTEEPVGVLIGRRVSAASLQACRGAPQYDRLDGYLVMDFVPTSELLTRWFHSLVQETLRDLDVRVASTIWQETPSSQAKFCSG